MNDITALLPHIRLRLNMEHPDLEECYTDGYECAKAQLEEEDNPFAAGSLESEQWLEGWWAGFYGDEPLFTLESLDANDRVEEPTAANDDDYHPLYSRFVTTFLKITGALAATAVVGYQVLDLVA